jgi:hypothetical protein
MLNWQMYRKLLLRREFIRHLPSADGIERILTRKWVLQLLWPATV